MKELRTQRQPPDVQQLIDALRPIIRTGLPVSPDLTDERLLGLRGVVARSIDANDRLNRVKALDGLIHKALASYPDDVLGQAAPILFGMAPGSRGQTLTERRSRAANNTRYDVDHFRKHIEPRILEQVAWMLHQDSQNYIPREREHPNLGTEPPIEASGDTPTITPGDLVSREYSEYQETLSQIWSHVYLLRAHILRFERLRVWPELDDDAHTYARKLSRTARQRDKQVRKIRILIELYIARYGEKIPHGEAEYHARALLRLAGWNTDTSR